MHIGQNMADLWQKNIEIVGISFGNHIRRHLEYLKLLKGDTSTPPQISLYTPQGWLIKREKKNIRDLGVRWKYGLWLPDAIMLCGLCRLGHILCCPFLDWWSFTWKRAQLQKLDHFSRQTQYTYYELRLLLWGVGPLLQYYTVMKLQTYRQLTNQNLL